LRSVPLAAIGILFFTAWPEELLFRGLLQNLLTKSLKSEWAGIIVAALVFGASHLNNGGFPNWRYGILATIAGIFYGRAWIKTGSLLPGAIVHALVDVLWHILFR
jgi:membrane protease YdiL (CAAX protease family)